MTDTSGMQTIVGLLETITTDGQLKTLALEVQRRGNRLRAERASAFREGEEVAWICRGRASRGVVERVEGSKVLVKLAHGFVARVSPSDLRRLIKPAARVI